MTFDSGSPRTDARTDDLLRDQDRLQTVRFITCGSVDDGKSTLIGRLLYDADLLPDDQRVVLQGGEATDGTGAEGIDFSCLVDGLQAEREQGITIDVGYRFFSTRKRRFIVADTPGHEQYTRNMATGASTADLAIVLVDASKGLLTQSLRHSRIVRMMGLRQVVLVVNKMDLVEWDQITFDHIASAYMRHAETLGFTTVTAIPISALTGENLVAAGISMPWYGGPTVIEALETAAVEDVRSKAPFRLPVQAVHRGSGGERYYVGTIASGGIAPGRSVLVQPAGVVTKVARLVSPGGDLAQAVAGQPVSLTMEDDVDIGRGDLLSDPTHPCDIGDLVEAMVLWMSAAPMLPHRRYRLQIGACLANASITELKHIVDVETSRPVPATSLGLNGIGLCTLSLDRSVAFDGYEANRDTGGFILIDRHSNETVGAGMIRRGLGHGPSLSLQAPTVDKAARALSKGQSPVVLWFTGLSGSGKSTIAGLLEKHLHGAGRHTVMLDGDDLRHGLNKDLGFTDADRVENIRRVAEVAKLMVDSGLIVLASLISPFRAERHFARSLMAEGEFLEIFVDAPLELCIARDPKGLYRKAMSGEIRNFTGLDSPYEAPEIPDFRIDTAVTDPEEAVAQIVENLRRRGIC